MSLQTDFKTVSEELFSGYLDENGYKWTYEPEIVGKKKRPDFLVRRDGTECLCDTKERSPKPAPPGARCFDPIAPVRELINKGKKKFREFDDRLCVLVVYNNGDCDTRLDPTCIFGAMLGDPGFTLDFDPEAGSCDPESIRNVFLNRGGSMIRHYDPLEPHESKTNLSAVAALTSYRGPNPAFHSAFENEVKARYDRTRRELTPDERLEIRLSLLQSVPMTLRCAPKLVVCTNPFARHLDCS